MQRNRTPHRASNIRAVARPAPIVIAKSSFASRSVSCQAAASVFNHEAVSNYVAAPNGKLISSTEVPAFIQRDDMIDQLFRCVDKDIISGVGKSNMATLSHALMQVDND